MNKEINKKISDLESHILALEETVASIILPLLLDTSGKVLFQEKKIINCPPLVYWTHDQAKRADCSPARRRVLKNFQEMLIKNITNYSISENIRIK